MKRFLALSILMLSLTISAKAQNSSDLFTEKFTTGMDIFNDFVMDGPDGIKFRGVNPGVNIYGMYTFPIQESNFAFAIGLGLGMHNIFSDAVLQDTSGVSFFTKIPDKAANGKDISYKKSKVSITYLDIPAEIRFKSENGIRIALGFKVGLRIDAHTKYKGDDLLDGDKTRLKEKEIPNLQTWRFGPTLQIGYKWVNLTGFYSISKVFEENSGPQIYPVSIGIALRPF